MRTKDLLKYRTAWMGFAALMVVFFHIDISPSSSIVYAIKWLGYAGTDVFFFASGIGCYFSLHKDPDTFRFLKRRLTRILPVFWCWLALMYGFDLIFGYHLSLRATLGNFLCVQAFTQQSGNATWYVPWLMIFYLLAPYFKGLADQKRGKQHFFIVGLLLILSIPFWKSEHLIAISRLPVYYLGMVFAKSCIEDRVISKKALCAAVPGLLSGCAIVLLCNRFFPSLLWTRGFYWYPFLWAAPCGCIVLSCILIRLEKGKLGRGLIALFNHLGNLSFEIFLVHVWLPGLLPHILPSLSNVGLQVAVLLLIYPVSVGVNHLARLSVRLLRKAK